MGAGISGPPHCCVPLQKCMYECTHVPWAGISGLAGPGLYMLLSSLHVPDVAVFLSLVGFEA